ncbi:MAG: penicillin-binding transpeptidase domain-containing protein [bacterium]
MEIEDENDEQIETTEEIAPRKLTKFWFVLIAVTIGFLIIIIRLFIVQVYDAKRFAARAKHQHESKIELRAERGRILDRNGKLIASTINSISIAVDPTILKDKLIVSKALEQATGISYRHFLRKINSTKGAFVWLVRGIMPDKAIVIDTLTLRGLIKFKEPRRNFLYGNVGSQVIGTTNIDNEGLSGLEKKYDNILTGRSGFMMMKRDARGFLHAAADLPVLPAVNGNSIVLTIDIELQRIVEYELQKGVVNSQAASGTVIVMEPTTGEILAMATYPSYDPTIKNNVEFGAMKLRAITDVYEPGSTFKVITASAAIEEGIMTPESPCNGYGGQISFGGFTIRDDHPIGKVSFREALEQSSNVIFAQVGDKLDQNKFYKYVRDFGFGNTSGIDFIGEEEGKIPSQKEFRPFVRRYLSHGYNLSATPLQMANAYSTVANGGFYMKPHLVKAILDSKGEVIETFETKKVRRVISENTSKTVSDMMCGVVEKGTGKRARVKGLKIAGKTGTAQQLVNGSYAGGHYTGSFIGFFPAENPLITVAVIMDRPQAGYYGGLSAAPVFQAIANHWIAINGNVGLEYDKKTHDTIFIPNVKGFFSRDAIRILRDYGFNPKLENLNDGIIISQYPQSGTKISKGSEIQLVARRFKTLISDTLDKINSSQEYKPIVTGFPLRTAVDVLQKAGIYVRIEGKGIVRSQLWSRDKKNKLHCTLICM